jgi:hypothetical protein
MRRALLTLLLVASACEAPPVVPGADKRQNTQLSRIEGELVVTSVARGNVVVLLFDAARPPPPTGTGRPVTFTVVPRERVFGSAADGEGGPFTAPYAFSLVARGRYIVRAFIDANGDFIPWYGVTGEVNAGDVGGAAVDALTRATRVIEIPEDLTPALDVPVSISDTARVPVDRPVFRNLDGAGELVLTAGGGPKVVELSPNPIDDGLIHEGAPAFLARFLDDNMDGMPDDANGDGVPEIWPRVIVRKLSDTASNPLLDENDVDRNGVLDEGGVDYEHLNPANGSTIPADGASDLVVLAAGFDPTDIAPLLVDSMGRPKPTATPVPKLKLVIRPTALDATVSTAPVPIKGLPSGRYAVVLIQQTGQTWRTPNELSPGIAEGLGFPAVASQAFTIVVP